MQNHSMLRPGYRRVRFLDTKCTFSILRTYCHSIFAEKNLIHTEFYASRKRTIIWQCVERMDKRTYVSLIHMAILTTIYWIQRPIPSPVFWHLWPCFHALHGPMPAINKPLNVWNCKWPILPSIHHMRNMRDYFLTILCTCLKNILNYIQYMST